VLPKPSLFASHAGPTAQCHSSNDFHPLPVWRISLSHCFLRIHRRQASGDDDISRTILYLPTGSILDNNFTEYDARVIEALRDFSNATIVTVHYRLGNGFSYPTPVHDVLAAYDYVQSELAEQSDKTAPISRRGRKQRSISKIGVCGQLLGGSLAAMLALTESKMGENQIAAAAVHNPIVDWVFPELEASSRVLEPTNEAGELIEDEPPSAAPGHGIKRRRPRRPKKNPPSWTQHGANSTVPTSALLRARTALFASPAAYFSPFASPTLFLRSPGADPPPPSDPGPLPAGPPPARRKVHRVFPPSASTLRLPHMLVSLSDASPLRDQGAEFARLLRRSVERDVRRGRSGYAVVDAPDDDVGGEEARVEGAAREAEERIRVWVREGSGVWGEEGGAWRADVREVGEWFGDVLG